MFLLQFLFIETLLRWIKKGEELIHSVSAILLSGSSSTLSFLQNCEVNSISQRAPNLRLNQLKAFDTTPSRKCLIAPTPVFIDDRIDPALIIFLICYLSGSTGNQTHGPQVQQHRKDPILSAFCPFKGFFQWCFSPCVILTHDIKNDELL